MLQKFLATLLILALVLTSAPAFALRGESTEGAGLEEKLVQALQDPGKVIQRFTQLLTPSPTSASAPMLAPAAGLEEIRTPEAYADEVMRAVRKHGFKEVHFILRIDPKWDRDQGRRFALSTRSRWNANYRLRFEDFPGDKESPAETDVIRKFTASDLNPQVVLEQVRWLLDNSHRGGPDHPLVAGILRFNVPEGVAKKTLVVSNAKVNPLTAKVKEAAGMEEAVQRLLQHKLTAVIPVPSVERAVSIGRIVWKYGIIPEITFRGKREDVLEAIRILASEGIPVWAGTVLTAEDARDAANNGAEGNISPALLPEVVAATLQAGKVPVPTVRSPKEAFLAVKAGANRFLKVFPILGGRDFEAQVKGPLPEDLKKLFDQKIELVPSSDSRWSKLPQADFTQIYLHLKDGGQDRKAFAIPDLQLWPLLDQIAAAVPGVGLVPTGHGGVQYIPELLGPGHTVVATGMLVSGTDAEAEATASQMAAALKSIVPAVILSEEWWDEIHAKEEVLRQADQARREGHDRISVSMDIERENAALLHISGDGDSSDPTYSTTEGLTGDNGLLNFMESGFVMARGLARRGQTRIQPEARVNYADGRLSITIRTREITPEEDWLPLNQAKIRIVGLVTEAQRQGTDSVELQVSIDRPGVPPLHITGDDGAKRGHSIRGLQPIADLLDEIEDGSLFTSMLKAQGGVTLGDLNEAGSGREAKVAYANGVLAIELQQKGEVRQRSRGSDLYGRGRLPAATTDRNSGPRNRRTTEGSARPPRSAQWGQVAAELRRVIEGIVQEHRTSEPGLKRIPFTTRQVYDRIKGHLNTVSRMGVSSRLGNFVTAQSVIAGGVIQRDVSGVVKGQYIWIEKPESLAERPASGLEEWDPQALIRQLQYKPEEIEQLRERLSNEPFVVLTAQEIRRLAASVPLQKEGSGGPASTPAFEGLLRWGSSALRNSTLRGQEEWDRWNNNFLPESALVGRVAEELQHVISRPKAQLKDLMTAAGLDPDDKSQQKLLFDLLKEHGVEFTLSPGDAPFSEVRFVTKDSARLFKQPLPVNSKERALDAVQLWLHLMHTSMGLNHSMKPETINPYLSGEHPERFLRELKKDDRPLLSEEDVQEALAILQYGYERAQEQLSSRKIEQTAFAVFVAVSSNIREKYGLAPRQRGCSPRPKEMDEEFGYRLYISEKEFELGEKYFPDQKQAGPEDLQPPVPAGLEELTQPTRQEIILNQEAGRLKHQGRMREALAKLDEALGVNPENPVTLTAKAGILLDMGNKKEALQVADRAAQLVRGKTGQTSRDAATFVVYARVLRENGKLAEAESAARAAVRLDSGSAGAQITLAQLLQDAKKLAEAELAARAAVRLSPGSPGAQITLAKVLRDAKKLEEAELAARAAVRLSPVSAGAKITLAHVLRDAKKLAEAESAARAAVQLSPDRPESHITLAHVLQDAKKLDEAESAARTAVRTDSASAGAKIMLAHVLRDAKKLVEAESVARAAVLLDPASAGAKIMLAHVLRDAKKLAEAESAARAAVGMDPASAGAQITLAQVLRDAKKLEEAELVARAAFRLDPASMAIEITLLQILRDAKKLKEENQAGETISTAGLEEDVRSLIGNTFSGADVSSGNMDHLANVYGLYKQSALGVSAKIEDAGVIPSGKSGVADKRLYVAALDRPDAVDLIKQVLQDNHLEPPYAIKGRSFQESPGEAKVSLVVVWFTMPVVGTQAISGKGKLIRDVTEKLALPDVVEAQHRALFEAQAAVQAASFGSENDLFRAQGYLDHIQKNPVPAAQIMKPKPPTVTTVAGLEEAPGNQVSVDLNDAVQAAGQAIRELPELGEARKAGAGFLFLGVATIATAVTLPVGGLEESELLPVAAVVNPAEYQKLMAIAEASGLEESRIRRWAETYLFQYFPGDPVLTEEYAIESARGALALRLPGVRVTILDTLPQVMSEFGRAIDAILRSFGINLDYKKLQTLTNALYQVTQA